MFQPAIENKHIYSKQNYNNALLDLSIICLVTNGLINYCDVVERGL